MPQPPRSHVRPKGKKRNWGRCKNSLSRIPCPHPHPEFTGSPPFLPHAPSPFPSNPLPSQVSFFSQQSFSRLPSQTQSLPHPLLHVPFSTPSLLLPSLSCPHLSGVGSLGGWPPPQPGCCSGGGGWLCLWLGRGVGVTGATGFGGVLAPADGGEVGVGGWAHSGRNGGGLSS